MEFIKVILSIKNPFDYSEYTLACIGTNVKVVSIGSYAQVVGMLKVAMVQYPDKTPEDAYLQFIQDMNTVANMLQQQALAPQSQGCSSCGDKKDKPLPSLAAQAGNLVSAVGQHAMSGFKSTDEETLANRNSICDKCDEMRSDGRCSKCGCYMQIKAKWDAAKCPVGKW